MTRNFRDEWDASSSGDEPSEAPQHVQDHVSALLRRSAQESAPAMPSDVEARLRAALSAEFGRDFDASAGAADHADRVEQAPSPSVPRVVALPMRQSAPATSSVTPDDDVTRAADEPIARPSAPAANETAAPSGASVVSLEERRARKGLLGKSALALGAAAAVAIGAVALTHTTKNDTPTADKAPTSTSRAGAVTQDYASRIRITQTETKYTAASLKRQATALPASTAPEVLPPANAQSVGTMGTKASVKSCLDAVAPTLEKAPDHVYADLASYDGSPAVIIVAQTGHSSKVWVVSRTCHVKDDAIVKGTPLTT